MTFNWDSVPVEYIEASGAAGVTSLDIVAPTAGLDEVMVLYGRVTTVADANVATRTQTIRVVDASGDTVCNFGGQTLTAGQTVSTAYFPGAETGTTTSGDVQRPIAIGLIIAAGCVLSASLISNQAGDVMTYRFAIKRRRYDLS